MKTEQKKPRSAIYRFTFIGQDLHVEIHGMHTLLSSVLLHSPFPLRSLGNGSEDYADFLGKHNRISHVFFFITALLGIRRVRASCQSLFVSIHCLSQPREVDCFGHAGEGTEDQGVGTLGQGRSQRTASYSLIRAAHREKP